MRSICADVPARPGSLASIDSFPLLLGKLCTALVTVRPEPVEARPELVEGDSPRTDLERRNADRRRCILDRHRETDADKNLLVGGVEDRRHDADHLSVCGHQRAARASRISRGVELDQIDDIVRAVARAVYAP